MKGRIVGIGDTRRRHMRVNRSTGDSTRDIGDVAPYCDKSGTDFDVGNIMTGD